MRNLSRLILLILVVSCSHNGVKIGLENDNQDVLRQESYMRYGQSLYNELSDSKNPLQLALINCHQGKIEEGLKTLKSHLNDYEKSPLYWNAMGNCFYLKNDFVKANFYYDLGLERAKKDNLDKALITNNLGLISLKQRKYQTALNYFEEASRLAPQYLTPRYNKAQIFIQFYHLDEAKNILLTLLNRAKEDVDVLQSLGTISIHQGHNKQAIDYFEKIPLKIRKRQDIGLHYSLALYQHGKIEDARAFLLKMGFAAQPHLRSFEQGLNRQIDKRMQERKVAQE